MTHRHTHHHAPRLVRATALPEPGGRARASRTTMAPLALRLLEALDEAQRKRAQWPFADVERFNWHFIPRERGGVAIKDMAAPAKAAVHDLLRAALSEAGYQKASDIMRLEHPLGLIENHKGPYRHPENYSVTIFGTPPRLPWGWRIEGHHLSLNFTAVTEDLFGVTPVFFGSNPAKVPDGYPMAGHRALGRETDLSYQLVRSLDDALRERAIIARTSLGNIITEPGREDALKEPQGLPLAAMDESSRNLALELLASFAKSLHADLAAAALDRIRAAGIEQCHFAWGGPLESGHANYWRLHGPISVIEYDNTQNNANHIHTVWHDLERDFGRDLLRQHYEDGHNHGHG
jgi:Protein of unknown function (DUF3500)